MFTSSTFCILSVFIMHVYSVQAKIRLKYRISWQQEGQETVEMGEVADFPAI